MKRFGKIAGALFAFGLVPAGITAGAMEYLTRAEYERRFAERQYVPEMSAEPGLHYRMRPDPARGINSLGMRGAEVPRAKAAGVYRVLVLGDSLTFGVHLPEDQSYPRALERLLNTNPAGFLGVTRTEVLNGGVPGYNLEEIGAALRVALAQLGPGGKPDLVVYGYFTNDFGPVYVIHDVGGAVFSVLPNDPTRTLIGGAAPGLHSWLMAKSRYYAKLVTLTAGEAARQAEISLPVPAQLTRGRALLRRLRDTAALAGVPLLAAALGPHVLARKDGNIDPFVPSQLTYHRQTYQEFIRMALELRIPVLDTLAVMGAEDVTDYFPPVPGLRDPNHPDRHGYEVIAGAIAKGIRIWGPEFAPGLKIYPDSEQPF